MFNRMNRAIDRFNNNLFGNSSIYTDEGSTRTSRSIQESIRSRNAQRARSYDDNRSNVIVMYQGEDYGDVTLTQIQGRAPTLPTPSPSVATASGTDSRQYSISTASAPDSSSSRTGTTIVQISDDEFSQYEYDDAAEENSRLPSLYSIGNGFNWSRGVPRTSSGRMFQNLMESNRAILSELQRGNNGYRPYDYRARNQVNMVNVINDGYESNQPHTNQAQRNRTQGQSNQTQNNQNNQTDSNQAQNNQTQSNQTTNDQDQNNQDQDNQTPIDQGQNNQTSNDQDYDNQPQNDQAQSNQPQNNQSLNNQLNRNQLHRNIQQQDFSYQGDLFNSQEELIDFNPQHNRLMNNFQSNNQSAQDRNVQFRNGPQSHFTQPNQARQNAPDLYQQADADIRYLMNENLRLRAELERRNSRARQTEQFDKLEHAELLASRKNLKIFSGMPRKEENFNDWLWEIERYMHKSRMPENKKTDFVSEFLSNNARDLFLSVPNCLFVPWNVHRENLSSIYNSPNTQNHLREKLKNLKQKSEMVSHVSKFDSIMGQIKDMSETDKIKYFLESLTVENARAVQTHMPTTLMQAKAVAVRVDLFKTTKQESLCKFCGETFSFGHKCGRKEIQKPVFQRRSQDNRYNRFQSNDNYRNYRNQPGNNANFNRNTQQNNEQGSVMIRSAFASNNNNARNTPANTYGYNNNNASNNMPPVDRNQQNSNNSNNNNNSSNRNRQFNNLVCDNMNNKQEKRKIKINTDSVDYFSDHFVSVIGREANKLMRIPASVNGNLIDCVLDIGATTSVMSESTVKRLNVALTEEIASISLGDGSTVDVRITEKIPIIVYNRVCNLEFLVTPMVMTEILLGLDWFNHLDVLVHPKAKMLKFSSETIPIQDNTDLDDSEEALIVAAYQVHDIQDDPLYYEFNETDELNLNINLNLPEDYLGKAKGMLMAYEDCFAKNYNELGRFSGRPIHLDIESSVRPIYQHFYSVNTKKLLLLREEINKLLEAGIIRPSRSEWGAPAFFVLKEGGSLRMVINFKGLNKHITKYHFPIRKIQDILQRLAGSAIFTTVDMKAGYLQFPLDEESKKYTAFTTPIGHFEFNTAPFGISNIPAEFACFGQQMFGDLDFVEVYFDDIIIFSKSLDLHLDHVRTVLDRFKQYNVRLNPEKCKFFQVETKILGHIVSVDGIAMNPAKIRAIVDLSEPTNIAQVETFIGFVSYYRKFIRNCADILQPLNNLKKRNIKFEFDDECRKSFNLAKQLLSTYPILRHPDMSRPFIIYTDASGVGMGAILAQKDENDVEYMIAASSKLFNKHELSYPSVMKECKALMFGIAEFFQYVEDSQFTVVTDHKSLEHIEKFKQDNIMIMRWYIILNTLDCKIVYRKGKLHANVDALSRLVRITHENDDAVCVMTRSMTRKQAILEKAAKDPIEATEQTNNSNKQENEQANIEAREKETSAKKLKKQFEKEEIVVDTTKDEVNDISKDDKHKDESDSSGNETEDEENDKNSRDPFINEDLRYFIMHNKNRRSLTSKRAKKIAKLALFYSYNGYNILYSKSKKDFKLIVPELNKRKEIITMAHLIGHFRVQATYDRLKLRYYWPNMIKQVKEVIDKCLVCIRNETSNATSHLPAQTIPVENIFDTVSVDLVFGLPTTKRGHKGICVICEHLTGFAYAQPISSKNSSEIASKIWNFISIFGPMKRLLSDRGTEFLNKLVKEMAELIGTEQVVTAAHHPEANGMSEKLNATLIRALRKLCEKDPYNWDLFLSFVTFAYNTRQHSTHGYAPYTGVFGIICNHFDDFDATNPTMLARRQNIDRIRHLLEEVQPNIANRRNEYAVKQKEIQDNSHKLAKEPFKIGDLVTVKSMKIQGKMMPKFNGLFRIESITSHGNYRLTNEKGELLKQSFLHSRLKNVPKDIELEEEEHMEVEKIIAHRSRNNQLQYLTLWKDTQEQSWEPEYNFDTTEVIDEYWAKQPDKLKPQVQSVLLSISKAFKLLTLCIGLNPLLFFLLFCVTMCASFEVSDTFKLCDISSPEVWNFQGSCEQSTMFNIKSNDFYHILAKRNNEFDGWATECSKKIIKVHAYRTFLFSDFFTKNEAVVTMTPEECELMRITKKCDNVPMNCSGDFCESTQEPKIDFAWLQDNIQTWSECQMMRRRVVAHNATSKILINQRTYSSCEPVDQYCQLYKSILIWPKSLIENCPYSIVKKINLDLFENILVSDMENKLFQITDRINICNNVSALVTAEGFYLTNDSRAFQLFDLANIDVKIIDGLLLTEMDYNKKQQLETILRSYQATNMKFCQLYKSYLNLYSKLDDEFVVFFDYNGNEAVIYANDGRIYVPQCSVIKSVAFLNETKNCFVDFPIMFNVNNQTYHAFLTPEKVIRMISKTTTCANNRKIIHLKEKNIMITKIENNIYVENEPNYNTIEVSLQNYNITSINFMVKHDSIIIDSIDILKEKYSIISKDEVIGSFHVMENEHSQSDSSINSILTVVNGYATDFSRRIHNILVYISLVITGCILLFIASFIA